MKVVVVVAMSLWICGCASEPELEPVMPPPPPQALLRAPAIPAQQIGRSVKHAPIELQRFGNAGPSVLIIAGIHGNERTTVAVGQKLSQHLQQHPELYRDRQVFIIPLANPDGFAANTRTNANGVDCNRNFPASNWRKARSQGRNGTGATSEPETQAIITALEMTKPRLIVSIHSIGEGRECNNYDGPALAIANLMNRYNKYPVTKTMGYPTPGSLGSYAGIDQNIPIITLELPSKQPGDAAWERNRQAILAAIAATR